MKKLTFLIFVSLGLMFFTALNAQQIDPPSMQLSAKLQRALEVDSVVDDLQKIVVLCANACEPKSAVAKPPSGRLRAQSKTTRDAASGLATGRRQHKPASSPTPTHDTGMAIIRKIGALSCTGAANCVDLIARKNSCKVGTVKCNAGGCRCTGR